MLNACNGSASQNWNISANAMNGSFSVATASTGLCMNVRGSSTAPGAVMEVNSCASGTASEQFNIQATIYANDLSNSTGTGGSTGGSTGTGGTGGSTGGSTGTGGTTPTFASSRTYRMIPQNATGESIDVCGGSQTTGTCVQQYATTAGDANQAFYLLANGSNWTITMGANQAMCLGANNNGTTNGTTVVVQACNGGTAQSYTAMPMSTSGVYAFKNVASGRCLNIQGPSTANGALMQLYDCGTTPGSNAQFSVQ